MFFIEILIRLIVSLITEICCLIIPQFPLLWWRRYMWLDEMCSARECTWGVSIASNVVREGSWCIVLPHLTLTNTMSQRTFRFSMDASLL